MQKKVEKPFIPPIDVRLANKSRSLLQIREEESVDEASRQGSLKKKIKKRKPRNASQRFEVDAEFSNPHLVEAKLAELGLNQA